MENDDLSTCKDSSFLINLPQSLFDDLLYERDRQWFSDRELNRSLRCDEPIEIALHFIEHCASGKKTAVVRKRRIPDQDFFLPESRNAVADHFRRI